MRKETYVAEPVTEAALEPAALVVFSASTCSRGRAAPKGLARGARGLGASSAAGSATLGCSSGGGDSTYSAKQSEIKTRMGRECMQIRISATKGIGRLCCSSGGGNFTCSTKQKLNSVRTGSM